MSVPPRLADRAALEAHRARARKGTGPESFLHVEALHEVQERLDEVNRSFTKPAIVTGFPEFWADAVPEAVVVPDTEVLDLREGAHDLVIHALALHWADDPVGQLVQARRALKPDGLFLAVAFAGETLRELRVALAEAETRQRGGLSPRVAPMGDLRDMGGLLQRAGFALPVADLSPRAVEYATPLHLMRELRAMGETNALAQRERRFLRRDVLARAVEIYAREFPGDNGRVRATFQFAFLTGWAPAASQPQPLKPGSASHRLAEALGSVEFDRDMNPVTDPTPRRDGDG
ncbi:methyltransferase domain-containing protein [Dinoroseobacter sp. PD6]|uniref:methyltransferase domain-containing protein n=1 Tax=Dinoroseobacter sp. PD6 TaxID=3028384 RepID=UPI00237A837D|nr:methyltransferase domain-containing protein [Dinoroseobacter sp. PD6]MDD9718049.1 methyltransferase domain-containing protein [Dinoroseobacter sp. PD6]